MDQQRRHKRLMDAAIYFIDEVAKLDSSLSFDLKRKDSFVYIVTVVDYRKKAKIDFNLSANCISCKACLIKKAKLIVRKIQNKRR